MLIIPEFERWQQKDRKFKVDLASSKSLFQKNKTKTKALPPPPQNLNVSYE